MSEHLTTQDELRHHAFDGIQEYDNPLPTWWLVLFWLTIASSAFYLVYYHLGAGESVEGQYNRNMLVVSDMQMKEILKLGPITNQTLNGLKGDQNKMLAAQALFQSKCSPCHGMQGEGNIGPNLTDDFWLHGALPTQIYTTVMEGVPAKGMLSWKTQLPIAQILTRRRLRRHAQGNEPAQPQGPAGRPVRRLAARDAGSEGRRRDRRQRTEGPGFAIGCAGPPATAPAGAPKAP